MTENDNKDDDGTDFEVLAECLDCQWKFHNKTYQNIRHDETDSKLDVSSRQAFLHSQATGHSVHSAFDYMIE